MFPHCPKCEGEMQFYNAITVEPEKPDDMPIETQLIYTCSKCKVVLTIIGYAQVTGTEDWFEKE